MTVVAPHLSSTVQLVIWIVSILACAAAAQGAGFGEIAAPIRKRIVISIATALVIAVLARPLFAAVVIECSPVTSSSDWWWWLIWGC